MTILKKPSIMSIRVDGTHEEMIALGKLVSEQYSKLTVLEAEKKEVAEKYKQKINHVECEIKSCCDQIQTGKIYVPQANVEEEWDTETETYRCTWLGRLVYERPFNAEDRERCSPTIFDIDEEKTQRKKPKSEVKELLRLETNPKTKKDHTV